MKHVKLWEGSNQKNTSNSTKIMQIYRYPPPPFHAIPKSAGNGSRHKATKSRDHKGGEDHLIGGGMWEVGYTQEFPWIYTLPETNIAPENGWLKDYFPFWDTMFSGAMLVSGRVDTNHDSNRWSNVTQLDPPKRWVSRQQPWSRKGHFFITKNYPPKKRSQSQNCQR